MASISPSTAADVFLRGRCRLAPDDRLATLLVGFDLEAPPAVTDHAVQKKVDLAEKPAA